MRRYETIFISDPDLSDADREQILERLKELITKYDGFHVAFDAWGIRKLAYEIKKKSRGYYVRADYCGDGALVDEMERSFRIDDRILKFMTIVLDKEVDLEALKEELAKEAEAKSAAQAEEEPAEAEAETAESEETETESSEEE